MKTAIENNTLTIRQEGRIDAAIMRMQRSLEKSNLRQEFTALTRI